MYLFLSISIHFAKDAYFARQSSQIHVIPGNDLISISHIDIYAFTPLIYLTAPVPVPPDWGDAMIEAASASPPNRKKEQGFPKYASSTCPY
jgi:hypothetical protein